MINNNNNKKMTGGKIENPVAFVKVAIMSISLGTIYTMGRKYQNIQVT